MMTIDYQIRGEKLQYDINSEAAKISSDNINKYEYLTGKEILPSNRKQIIKQANSIYSLLRKAIEKQIKGIEDPWEKEIKKIQNEAQIKTIKKYAYNDKDSALILKQRTCRWKIRRNTNLDEKFNSAMCGKCPDTELFPVLIFLYSDWIRRFTN